ncbi:uncharacterized protein TRIADDRAFT_60097 [Trichoplax adhaerens]|uniref:Rho-GAP domain-containing protein n=1 Tax=Trichoplax adhaerens TaxID=10228 RepID=B3S7A6_TRIAD|nr:hypothetical protein TRIADDRAFT_60097 [Trichoplax adhaerens]EDV21532.1 hypothetical protein TRIADDRAFT_60097 [Trichoplax adhaerens]|eukprot:XP_002116132.1 hypothetical protein TRIADDRAFT_60097 [Trichoplax adhaerens]
MSVLLLVDVDSSKFLSMENGLKSGVVAQVDKELLKSLDQELDLLSQQNEQLQKDLESLQLAGSTQSLDSKNLGQIQHEAINQTKSLINLPSKAIFNIGHNDATRVQSSPELPRISKNQIVNVTEKDAGEACQWLKFTGFSRYARAYEDGQFPIDIATVKKDNSFMDASSINAVIRRINLLNQYVNDNTKSLTPNSSSHTLTDTNLAKPSSLDKVDSQQASHTSSITKFSTTSKLDIPQQTDRRKPDRAFTISSFDKNIRKPFVVEPVVKGNKNELVALSSRFQDRSKASAIPPKFPVYDIMTQISDFPDKAAGYDNCIQSPEVIRTSSVGSNYSKRPTKNYNRTWNGDTSKNLAKSLLNVRQMDPSDTNIGSDSISRSSVDIHSTSRTTQRSTELESSEQSKTITISNNRMSNMAQSGHKKPRNKFIESRFGLYGMNANKSITGSFPLLYNKRIENTKDRYHARSSSGGDDYAKRDLPFMDGHSNLNIGKDNDATAESNNQLSKASLSSSQKSASLADLVVLQDDSSDLEGHKKSSMELSDRVETDSDSSDPNLLDSNSHRFHDAVVLRKDSHALRQPSLAHRVSKKSSKWHPFGRAVVPVKMERDFSLSELTAGQFAAVQKFAFSKLTEMLENQSSTKQTLDRLLPSKLVRKRPKNESRDKLLNLPLWIVLERTGRSLPQSIINALDYLRRNAIEGIFRKAGVKSRVSTLRKKCEANSNFNEFEKSYHHDIADMLKGYFRELPEPVFNSKMTEILVFIKSYVESDLRFYYTQLAVLLMPDESRDALRFLLEFLSDVASHSDMHQMTINSLAVCLSPSLFSVASQTGPLQKILPWPSSPSNLANSKEINDSVTVIDVLDLMIRNHEKLFTISSDIVKACDFTSLDLGQPLQLSDLGRRKSDGKSDFKSYIKNAVGIVINEYKNKFSGWVPYSLQNGIEISFKKASDDYPLSLARAVTTVNGVAEDILELLLNDRHLWDKMVQNHKVVETLDCQTDIHYYVKNSSSMSTMDSRDYYALRSWRTHLQRGSCVLVSASISYNSALPIGETRGIVLAERFLIEPTERGESRLTYIFRIDDRQSSEMTKVQTFYFNRGHAPDYYERGFNAYLGLSIVSGIKKLVEDCKK